MGGSSLGPEVFAQTSAVKPAALPCWCSISPTRPRSARVEAQIDPARTLFIVSSKSGTTLEPNILKQYFFECAEAGASARRTPERASSPSPIRARSWRRPPSATGFRHIAHGIPSIGGRYSVLSNFGLVPAAAMGLDVARLFGKKRRRWCARARPAFRPPTIPASSLAPSWACSPRSGATSSLSWLRPALPISAPGWSNCWPN